MINTNSFENMLDFFKIRKINRAYFCEPAESCQNLPWMLPVIDDLLKLDSTLKVLIYLPRIPKVSLIKNLDSLEIQIIFLLGIPLPLRLILFLATARFSVAINQILKLSELVLARCGFSKLKIFLSRSQRFNDSAIFLPEGFSVGEIQQTWPGCEFKNKLGCIFISYPNKLVVSPVTKSEDPTTLFDLALTTFNHAPIRLGLVRYGLKRFGNSAQPKFESNSWPEKNCRCLFLTKPLSVYLESHISEIEFKKYFLKCVDYLARNFDHIEIRPHPRERIANIRSAISGLGDRKNGRKASIEIVVDNPEENWDGFDFCAILLPTDAIFSALDQGLPPAFLSFCLCDIVGDERRKTIQSSMYASISHRKFYSQFFYYLEHPGDLFRTRNSKMVYNRFVRYLELANGGLRG